MHFFNSLQEDFANIGSDLTEFVETVKKDTSKALGINFTRNAESNNEKEGDNSWLDDLFDNPELLIEEKVTVTELDAKVCEKMLRGENEDSGVPELYVELVPAAMTHEDFFLRLLSYRVRVLLKPKTTNNNLLLEEEVGWDEENAEMESKKKPTTSSSDDKIINELKNRVADLERLLEISRAEKKELEIQLEKLEGRNIDATTPVSPTANSVVLVESVGNKDQLTKNENSWDVLNDNLEVKDTEKDDDWD